MAAGTSRRYKRRRDLLTRAWARDGGITTTYGYDDGGRLTSTDYSDATPDVIYGLDALGRNTLVSTAVASCTYAYDTTDLRIDTETVSITGGPTRVIDRSDDALGRNTGWELLDGSTVEHAMSIGYDAAGRSA